jgi:putative DNA primase/helicase
MSESDDTPSDKVKKAMARKRVVTDAPIEVTRGKTTLKVHEGGKPARKPRAGKRPPHPAAGAATLSPEGRGEGAGGAGDSEQPPQDDGHDGPPEGTPPEDIEKAKSCAPLDQNDRDNARRLIIWFGDDLAYVSGMGWLTWRGTHWQRDEGDLGARLLGQSIVDKIKLEAAYLAASPLQQRVLDAAAVAGKKPMSEQTPADLSLMNRAGKILEALSKRRSDRKKFAVSTGNAAKTSAMLMQAASLKSLAAELLDADLKSFNLQNGTLKFERVENEESDPDASDLRLARSALCRTIAPTADQDGGRGV